MRVRTDPAVADLKSEAGVLVFRAARELLNNVQRHSGADLAWLEADVGGRMLTLRVEDEGRGFDPGTLDQGPQADGGFGLFSIREEIRQAGGVFKIDSAPGEGAIIRVSVPMSEPADTRPEA